MVANGRPEIIDTGATIKAQGGGGYAPPGRNCPTSGAFGHLRTNNPYSDPDNDLDEDDYDYRPRLGEDMD